MPVSGTNTLWQDGTIDVGTLKIGAVEVTATPAELNIMDGVTSTTAELNILDGVTSTAAELNILDGVTATTGELNNAADVSARVTELTASGALTAGQQSLELNHDSVIIAATIADAVNHQGLFIVKDTSGGGTAAHTLALTAGTFDGTNTLATFNLLDETLVIYFDSAGRGTVILNLGSVALSAP